MYLRVLKFPKLILGVLGVLAALAVFFGARFSFDASSDTLVVKGDPDLAAYDRVAETFGGDDFLLLTFSPAEGRALDPENLATVQELQDRLEDVEGVGSVFSILDVPLLRSPPVPLAELARGFVTLRSDNADLELARAELRDSPVFSRLLITPDGETTAMRVDLALVVPAPGEDRAGYLQRRDRLIAEVRAVRDGFSDRGVLYIGGVPMIAADMIAFVKADLAVFGGAVLALMMLGLFAFFRSLRWVVLPIATSALTIAFTIGVLGLVQWPATVISSNFIALLSIITISLTIHLIVRYRELAYRDTDRDLDTAALVGQTMVSKTAPCLYTTLTTMAAFGSLTAAQIVPVEDFGWMMCIGIAIGFVVSFSFFPAVLMVLPPLSSTQLQMRELSINRVFSHMARWHGTWVIVLSAGWLVAVVLGLTLLSLDNRFIDYFKKDTDINQGMRFVDAELGGTLPFDVVLKFPPYEQFSEPDDFFGEEEEAYPQRYWFTRDKLDKVEAIHRYLGTRSEVGKVLSLTSLEDLAREFTDGEPLSNLEVVAVLDVLPEHLREEFIRPYASPETGEVRLTARVIESGPHFDRRALTAAIREYAQAEVGFAPDAVEITGMMVLFDSMLQQLFTSQVDTLAYVLLATFSMFVILLRSVLFAILGLIPNIIAAASVLALMGYAGIPLDLMTITIAAISIGIGVDDAIHYLHRFRDEYRKDRQARLAVAWSHATIGRAMYFTSITIIMGFSVLVFSNFVPTMLFGVLTAVAMSLAMVANLTLLPALLVAVLGERRRKVSDFTA